jgi:thiol-disulfide isomerase/thioredoxin
VIRIHILQHTNRTRARRIALAPALALAASTLLACVGEVAVRGPAWEANPDAAPATDTVVGSVRFITQEEAGQRLLVDSVFPTSDVRLLWFQGRATSAFDDGSVLTLDGWGGAIRVDPGLMAHRVPLRFGTRTPMSIAAGTRGSVWVTATDGTLFRLHPGGWSARLESVPFDYAALSGDPAGGVWLVRSTEFFSHRPATATDPLLARLDSTGAWVDTVPGVRLSEHGRVTELANAGHVLVTGDMIFLAPFIRDEVLALTPTGDTLWVARRGLLQESPNPRFAVGDDGPVIDYVPVNLGIAIGSDSLLYVLSVPGLTTAGSRIDVYDGSSGQLLRTARMDTPFPTVAVDATGRLYALDPFRVLTVLNFWASWCGPCRVEMPALVHLAESIDDSSFAFATMNEDVDVSDAARFASALGFEYPVALGKGKLRQQYHYLGLPFTVVLDRGGNIVYRWTGFAGDEQLEGVRSVIRAELDRERRTDEQGDDGTDDRNGAMPADYE